jgi:[pyruvate, water dikinase]-phosphate phosphotransferase / [pyruvate, water dikinase] kinase
MTRSHDEPLLVVLLSGATGRTATQVVNAALAQFDHPLVRVIKQHNVRTATAARKIVRDVGGRRAVICHSLVSPVVRDAVAAEAKRQLIPTVDILGGVLAVLSDQLGAAPRGKPGLLYKLHKEQFDRIDAVGFTLSHDDGAGLATLADADVVLVGVSRASKSVTCFYLAYRGVCAANVPLIRGIDAPAELLAMPRDKVIGLTIAPGRLRNVREARRAKLGHAAATDYYVGHAEIDAELKYALKLMRKHGWRCIDVSYMAVEEVAAQVLQYIGQ